VGGWRQRQNSDELPFQFYDVLAEVIDFAEPAITDNLTAMTWDFDDQKWV
jgi:hypothetical protein